MITLTVIFIFFVAIIIIFLAEPRILLVLFHKLLFPVKSQNAIHIDKTIFFPKSFVLESNYVLIKQEIDRVINGKLEVPKFHHVDKANHKISFEEGPAWRTLIMKAYGSWFAKNCERLPITFQLLKNMPEVSTAMISILEPNVSIPAHTGKLHGYLRYHLALSVPERGHCYITVNGIKYYWREGEGILFDDTYLHSVNNNTNEYRIVLLLDINRKTYRFGEVVNEFILKLIRVSPLFKRAKRTGIIKVD